MFRRPYLSHRVYQGTLPHIYIENHALSLRSFLHVGMGCSDMDLELSKRFVWHFSVRYIEKLGAKFSGDL